MTTTATSTRALKEELLRADRGELRRWLAEGRAVMPRALEGFAYRGTSLGLPRLVERLTWKSFEKCFWRHPENGRLFGWNVRLHQDGLDAPSRPKTMRRGAPVTTWHYEVLEAAAAPLPASWPTDLAHGLVIDYARVQNPLLDTVRLVKDPLVDVGDGSGELLLGVSLLLLPGLCIETPTFFLLERSHPIDYVPPCMLLSGEPPAQHLLPFERRLAEQIFDAIIATDGALPRLDELDHAGFWRALEGASAPHTALGLRATVHVLNLAPLLLSGVRRPLAALPRAARAECLERLSRSPRYALRQLVATAKILACFATFEHDAVRTRLGGDDATSGEDHACAA